MVVFPHAKINLGLRVYGRRPDGYHAIETLMAGVTLSDILEIHVSDLEHDRLFISGSSIDAQSDENLCMKALNLVRKDFPIPILDVYLHKIIPAGSGLGGGSADAAYMLKLLNTRFNLSLSGTDLFTYAAQLGSDCSFFLHGKPMVASGRGEVLEPISFPLPDCTAIIVKAKNSMSTALAYAKITPKPCNNNLTDILHQPDRWKEELHNDFEAVVFRQYPEVAAMKEELYRMGAFFALMSGSGTSVYGLFKTPPAQKIYFPDCFTWSGKPSW